MADSETQQQMTSKTPRSPTRRLLFEEYSNEEYLNEEYSDGEYSDGGYLDEEYLDEAANLLIEGCSNALALCGATDIKDAPNLKKRPRKNRIENRLDAQHAHRRGFSNPVHGKIRNEKTRRSGER